MHPERCHDVVVADMPGFPFESESGYQTWHVVPRTGTHVAQCVKVNEMINAVADNLLCEEG